MDRALASACVEILVATAERPSEADRIAEKLRDLVEALKKLAAEGEQRPPPEPRPEACEKTKAWQELTQRFGTEVSVRELKTIAAVVADHAHLPPPGRTEQRKRPRLFGWFDEHWDRVRDLLPFVKIENFRPSDSDDSP
jgi:hypothetical protein